MKKTVKAYDPLTIIGILISIVVGGLAFINWSSHEEFSLSFPKNVSEKISSYYSCNSDDLIAFQSSGSSSCKYTIYTQTRNASAYICVVSNLSFSKNNEWDGSVYSLEPSYWNDIRFKVKKTGGVSGASEIVLSLGRD